MHLVSTAHRRPVLLQTPPCCCCCCCGCCGCCWAGCLLLAINRNQSAAPPNEHNPLQTQLSTTSHCARVRACVCACVCVWVCKDKADRAVLITGRLQITALSRSVWVWMCICVCVCVCPLGSCYLLLLNIDEANFRVASAGWHQPDKLIVLSHRLSLSLCSPLLHLSSPWLGQNLLTCLTSKIGVCVCVCVRVCVCVCVAYMHMFA